MSADAGEKANKGEESDAPSPLHEFVLRVLAVLGLVALALFLWRIVHVLLLVFGAGLLAIALHAAAEPIRLRMRRSSARSDGIFAVPLAVVLTVAVGRLYEEWICTGGGAGRGPDGCGSGVNGGLGSGGGSVLMLICGPSVMRGLASLRCRAFSRNGRNRRLLWQPWGAPGVGGRPGFIWAGIQACCLSGEPCLKRA